MSEGLNLYWEELCDFIKNRNSIDIGALNHLNLIITRNPPEQQIFHAQILSFLEQISTHAKNNSIQYSESFALMSLDALIYNMYKMVKGNDEFKPNSSSFYGWMSNSHLSADLSEMSNQGIEKESKKVISLIEYIANSQKFFKRIKLILDRNNNKQRNQRYGQNLVQTLDYIINKQKCKKQNFKIFKTKYITNSIAQKPSKNIDYININKVIFSNHLNKIAKILTDSEDQVHFALIRIYLAASQNIQRKQFQGHQFSAEDILFNLYRFYIENFKDKNQIFAESKHPIYRMLRNLLIQKFIPIFRHFHYIIQRICQKGDEQNTFNFYSKNQSIIKRQLSNFISLIPHQLIKLLNTLYKIVDKFHQQNSESSVTPVKKLIIYSFLLSQQIIQDLLSKIDPVKYNSTYNHILNLFFQGSINKYASYDESQIKLVSNLIKTISNELDERIKSPVPKILKQNLQEPLQFQFTITQPILNHDYQIISEKLQNIQFTPKDDKTFHMKKQFQPQVQSPIYKPFRKQTQFYPQKGAIKEDQIDFFAWMSVGGSRQWRKQQVQPNQNENKLKQRLSRLQTLKGGRILELERLKGKFEYYF